MRCDVRFDSPKGDRCLLEIGHNGDCDFGLLNAAKDTNVNPFTSRDIHVVPGGKNCPECGSPALCHSAYDREAGTIRYHDREHSWTTQLLAHNPPTRHPDECALGCGMVHSMPCSAIGVAGKCERAYSHRGNHRAGGHEWLRAKGELDHQFDGPKRLYCGSRYNAWTCDREPGHTGKHQVGNGLTWGEAEATIDPACGARGEYAGHRLICTKEHGHSGDHFDLGKQVQWLRDRDTTTAIYSDTKPPAVSGIAELHGILGDSEPTVGAMRRPLKSGEVESVETTDHFHFTYAAMLRAVKIDRLAQTAPANEGAENRFHRAGCERLTPKDDHARFHTPEHQL